MKCQNVQSLQQNNSLPPTENWRGTEDCAAIFSFNYAYFTYALSPPTPQIQLSILCIVLTLVIVFILLLMCLWKTSLLTPRQIDPTKWMDDGSQMNWIEFNWEMEKESWDSRKMPNRNLKSGKKLRNDCWRGCWGCRHPIWGPCAVKLIHAVTRSGRVSVWNWPCPAFGTLRHNRFWGVTTHHEGTAHNDDWRFHLGDFPTIQRLYIVFLCEAISRIV